MNVMDHFRRKLAGGSKLCLMPISRVLIEQHIVDPIPGYVFYPPGTLDLETLNVVWDPESAWGSEIQLGWEKSAATQISKDEFNSEVLLAFTVDFVDWAAFLDGDHEYHLDVLRRSSEQAEHLMDLVRLHYCRMDLPQTLPGRVSMLGSGSPFSCGLFYALEDHESYLIAGQIMQSALVGGIGLDCDGIHSLDVIASGETGKIARWGLRLLTQALEADQPSSKFAQCWVALEFLANPYPVPSKHRTMSREKSRIGAHVAKDKADYHAFCNEIEDLYGDLRTKIVHGGQTFEAIVPARDQRARIFRRLQQLISLTIRDMIEHSPMSWADFQAHRDRRLQALGLP